MIYMEIGFGVGAIMTIPSLYRLMQLSFFERLSPSKLCWDVVNGPLEGVIFGVPRGGNKVILVTRWSHDSFL